jgi:hypothetical protein
MTTLDHGLCEPHLRCFGDACSVSALSLRTRPEGGTVEARSSSLVGPGFALHRRSAGLGVRARDQLPPLRR